MKNIEIEIQVKIGNTKNLIKFLKKKAKFLYENHQIDEYFTPSHRNFIKTRPAKEWLRLRSEENNYSITYKNWYFTKEGKSYHCDEFETTIGDIKQLKNILKVLNFKSLVTIDKIRKTWKYKNYEIAVDAVRGLGNFVEIEYKGKEKSVDPQAITEEMINFLKDNHCGKITRNYKGYPFLKLFPKEAEYEIE
jgi:adenylate cyclase class 2